MLVRQGMNWQEAQAHCNSLDRKLMEIRTQEEYEIADMFIRNVEAGRIWLGGTNTLQGHEGNWVWLSNAEIIDRSRFWAIANNEPNGGPDEECLEMSAQGMNDIACGPVLPFVCEVV